MSNSKRNYQAGSVIIEKLLLCVGAAFVALGALSMLPESLVVVEHRLQVALSFNEDGGGTDTTTSNGQCRPPGDPVLGASQPGQQTSSPNSGDMTGGDVGGASGGTSNGNTSHDCSWTSQTAP